MGIPIGSNLNQGVYHPENKSTSGGPKPPAPLSPAAALAEHIALQSGQTPQQVAPTLAPENETYVPGFEDGGHNRLAVFQDAQFRGLGSAFDQYLAKYNSPLEGLGNAFVRRGKRAGIDPRLLLAISGAETTFMTDPQASPASDHNAFGIGGPHGQGGFQFPSWKKGIGYAANLLAQDYFRQGYDTIEKISGKWAPLSDSRDTKGVNQYWADNVGKFYKELGGVRPGFRDIPRWGGAQQLIYDPKGYWFRGQKGVTEQAYGGHDTHIHAAFSNPRAMLKAYRVGSKHGLDFTENPYTGQVYPVHAGQSEQYGDYSGGSTPSWHYRTFPGTFGPDNKKLGEAWDINDPDPNSGWDLARMFDFLAPRMVGSANYNYGTSGDGGYQVSGPATHQQAVAARQQARNASELLGSSLASYEVTPGSRRRKRKSPVDDLIANLANIQAGGSYLGA